MKCAYSFSGKLLVVLLFFSCFTGKLFAWGFYAHKKINRLAVFTLPEELFGFYKENIEFISEHAVDPDKRRYAVKGEAAKHYIDLDHYGKYPFTDFPKSWSNAVETYSEDTIKTYGVLPWNILWTMNKLTEAFKEKDKFKILKHSAELGHYIGDSHVPLHTTKNYNGHLTNQEGIHGFWESRLPELYSEDYDFWVGTAAHVNNPFELVWDIVLESHSHLDSVLQIEKSLDQAFPSDKKFVIDNRGETLLKTYTREYSNAYHTRLDNMVEQRMTAAIINTGSLWYTCWNFAGKPNLQEIQNQSFSPASIKELTKAEKAYQNKGEIHGREHTEHGSDIK